MNTAVRTNSDPIKYRHIIITTWYHMKYHFFIAHVTLTWTPLRWPAHKCVTTYTSPNKVHPPPHQKSKRAKRKKKWGENRINYLIQRPLITSWFIKIQHRLTRLLPLYTKRILRESATKTQTWEAHNSAPLIKLGSTPKTFMTIEPPPYGGSSQQI